MVRGFSFWLGSFATDRSFRHAAADNTGKPCGPLLVSGPAPNRIYRRKTEPG